MYTWKPPSLLTVSSVHSCVIRLIFKQCNVLCVCLSYIVVSDESQVVGSCYCGAYSWAISASYVLSRAVKRLIVLIARFIFNRTLITISTHLLFVTFFSLFVFHLWLDVVGPLLLNAGWSTPSIDEWLVSTVTD